MLNHFYLINLCIMYERNPEILLIFFKICWISTTVLQTFNFIEIVITSQLFPLLKKLRSMTLKVIHFNEFEKVRESFRLYYFSLKWKTKNTIFFSLLSPFLQATNKTYIFRLVSICTKNLIVPYCIHIFIDFPHKRIINEYDQPKINAP